MSDLNVFNEPRTLSLSFHYEILGKLRFDLWPGIMIRSRLGYSMFQLYGEHSDVYQQGFRHSLYPSRAGYLLRNVPDYLSYRPGQKLSFTLVLIGDMIHFATHFAESLLHFEKTGLGYGEHQQPGKLKLTSVTAAHKGEWHPADGFDQPFPRFKYSTMKQIKHVMLIPKSPIRISVEGTKDVLRPSQLSSEFLFRSLWNRIAYLHRDYNLNIPIEPNSFQLQEDFSVKTHPDRYYDASKFDTSKWNLKDGFKNILEFQGDLQEILPLLLLGNKIGLGEQCSFGLGSYELAILDDTQFGISRAQKALNDLKSNKMTIHDREFIRHEDLKALSYSVSNKKYVPPPLQKFVIGNREISAPALSDRIVQRWVNDYMVSFFNDTLSSTAYGYRPGYSAAKAVKRVMHEVKHNGFRFGVNLDIRHFFDTIDRQRMISLLYDLPMYLPMLQLIYQWLENGGFRYGVQWESSEEGIGQGNVVSPILSNLYLTHFDNYIEQLENVLMIRYSDDFVILARSREELEKAIALAENWITRIGKLSLHPDYKICDFKEELLPFMGIAFNGEGARIDPERAVDKREKLMQKAETAKNADEAAENIHLYLERLGAYYGQVLEKAWPYEQIRLIEPLLSNKMQPHILEGFKSVLSRLHAQSGISVQADVQPQLRKSKQDLEKERRRAIQEAALQRSVIVDQPYSILRLRQGTLFIENQKGSKTIALRQLQHVFISAGNSLRITAPLIIELARRGIHLVFLDKYGEAAAWLSGKQRFAAKDFIAQYHYRDSIEGAELARKIMFSKTGSQINLVKYWNKSRNKAFDEDLEKMNELHRKLKTKVIKLDLNWRQEIMNIEAAVASHYWKVVKIILSKYDFPGRKRQGAKDPINSALNYGYGILLGYVNQALLKVGIIAELGVLHADQYGKPTLAYDFMELFRQPFIDRAVIAMAAKGKPIQVNEKGFLTDDSRKQLLKVILNSLSFPEEYLGVPISRIQIIERQALEIQKDIRKNESNFKPYRLIKW
jgi:CRISP-associated protein Cas1